MQKRNFSKTIMILFFVALFVGSSFAGLYVFSNASAIAPSSLCKVGYGLTPYGCAPDSCIHVLSGTVASIETIKGVTVVTYSDGTQARFPACPQSSSRAGPGIDTNGWVEDAESNDKSTTQMSGNWTVPSAPSSNDGQTIFMFIGTQNCVCDDAFILQPVLQWGTSAAGGGAYWTLASWYVDSNYLVSKLIRVSAGNTIVGTMNGANCNADGCYWTIKGADANTGHSTTLKVKQRLALQTDNFVTLEVYGVVSCSDYPASGSTTFTGLLVNSKNSPKWSNNVLQNDGCGENVVINSRTSVTLDY